MMSRLFLFLFLEVFRQCFCMFFCWLHYNFLWKTVHLKFNDFPMKVTFYYISVSEQVVCSLTCVSLQIEVSLLLYMF